MHVALVHLRQSGTGGTERYLNQMAAHLCEHGHEVTIVCRSYESAPHPRVKFVRLRSPVLGSSWRMWAFARAVENHINGAGYELVYGLGRAWTHDVIRLGGGCHQTYLDLAHRHTRARWEHALQSDRLKQQVALAIETRALQPGAYRQVIVNSEMVKRDVIARYGIPEKRLRVVYNGVDLERFDRHRHTEAARGLRRECGFSAKDMVVLFLGTGYGRKGLASLLRAFAVARSRDARLRLMIVGYDSARRGFERLAARLGLTPSVTFLGGRRDAEVCYAAADLYALPTYYDPFANSTLEALASGLPVITTIANGGAEVLKGEVTGSVLQRPDDLELLAEQLVGWSNRDRLEAARGPARRCAERYPQSHTTVASTAVLLEAWAEKTHSGASDHRRQ